MQKTSRNRLIVFFFALLILLLDWLSPLGYEDCVFYIIPVSLLYFLNGNRPHYLFTAFCSVLIIIGFFISPRVGIPEFSAVYNRILGVIVLWSVSILLRFYRKVLVNVSELREAQDATIKEKQMTDTAINSLPGVFYLFGGDGKLMRWNRNLEIITGYSFDEIEKMSMLDFFDEDGKKIVKDTIDRVFTTGHAKAEAQLVSKNGKKVPFYFLGCRMFIDDRPYLIGSGVNITRQKRAEAVMRRKAIQLESSNKELEAFSYSVTHDLKSPLFSISGFANILQSEFSSQIPEEAREYLERIILGSQKMSRIIEDILKLSKISKQEVKKTSVNMSEIALSIINDLRQAEPERRVDVKIQDRLVCNADEGLLTVALSNLIRNAWKYTGKVDKPVIEFGKTIEKDRTIYFVADDGAGFDMKDYDKLFTPFKRLHPETEFTGTGVGLPIVARVIKKHGGEIWAKSEKGKGATFFFTVP